MESTFHMGEYIIIFFSIYMHSGFTSPDSRPIDTLNLNININEESAIIKNVYKDEGKAVRVNGVKVDPAKFAGVWYLAFTTGFQGKVFIKRDGKGSLRGREIVLQQSDNQVNFPSSEGWMMSTKSLRDTTWDYIRIDDDGKLKIQHFCTDNCNGIYSNLQHYCCIGVGSRGPINAPAPGNDYRFCPISPCRPCFPGTSMVMLDEGGKKSMEELRIGDVIMTVENWILKPTRVLGFLDKRVNQTAYYFKLALQDNRSLFISSTHVMFIKGNNNIIQNILAKDVNIGDIVIIGDGVKIGFVPIIDITVELKMGGYVPLTNAGTLLVDGVFVSSYANADHWLAHLAVSPLRWWPTLLLDTEESQHLEGFRTFPRMMRNLGSILGLVTRADGNMETKENPILGMSQLGMEKMDKTEF